MHIAEYRDFQLNEILALYESVGWSNYTDRPALLKQAYENSLLVLGAYAEDRLVGVVRLVGDGFSIVFIQDLLVIPEYQRRGIGTALMRTVMERYRDVYQMELLTDNTEKTAAFYHSLGFRRAAELGCLAFVRM